MFFIFPLLSSFLFLTTAGADSCSDITLSDCNHDNAGLIIALPDIPTDKDCQDWCNGSYEGDCRFYEFDMKKLQCSLYRNHFEELYGTCQIIGGPIAPPIQNCTALPESSDPCNMYLSGDCDYTGKEILPPLPEIKSADDCSQLCNTNGDACKYFLYDDSEQKGICTLLDDAKVDDCDTLRGPPKPTKEQCEKNKY